MSFGNDRLRYGKIAKRAKAAENVNISLLYENKYLKRQIEIQQESIDTLIEQMDKIRDEYEDAINEAREIRSEYLKLINETASYLETVK